MKIAATTLLAASVAAAFAQTPPVQPQVTPVPTPPPVTLPGPSNPQVTKPITAEDAARIALANQPSLLISSAQVLAAQGRTQQVRSNLLPQATITSDYQRFQSFRTASGSGGSGSSTGFNSSITVSQLLFDFNHSVDLVRQAAAQEAASRHDLTAAQADTVLQVKEAYYQYQQDQQLVSVEDANVTSTNAQLTYATARLQAGLGAPADVLQAATDLASASQALAQARQTALNSRITLAFAMGIDPRTPIDLAASEEPAPPSDSVESLVTTALTQRPEIKSANQSLRAAGFGLSAARTGNAPRVDASASAGSRGPDDPFASQSGTLGISFNWPIFDGGFTVGSVKVARADLQTAQANLKQASLNAVSDVSQAYVALKSAEQRVAIGQSQVANATESVRLAEGRFKAGVTTFLEVTTAQSQLVAAQVSLVNAQTLVQQARAQLLHAIGTSLAQPR